MGNPYAGLGFNSLLTDGDNNPKTAKSNAAGSEYYTALMHLAHASTGGFGNVCASASPGCIASCLDIAGHGQMLMVQRVRAARTRYFFQERIKFAELLKAELNKFVAKCKKLGKLPAIRLNGTSDIVWEKIFPELFGLYPTIQFYDYTKHAKRAMKSWKLPENYHLTFSRSEINDKDCRKVLRSGRTNVAVVFEDTNYPPTWAGKPVYSMDDSDLRFLDPPGGHVGALYAKGGKARHDETGFVLPTDGGVKLAAIKKSRSKLLTALMGAE